MPRYILDSNLYIEAARDRAHAAELEDFSTAVLPFLHMHAVVAQELLAGATSAAWLREIDRGLIAPFQRRQRMIVPSWKAWRRSGEIIAELIRLRRLSRTGVKPSFLNDALLAASCREHGIVLVTRNRADFEKIAKVEPFQFSEPWPAL